MSYLDSVHLVGGDLNPDSFSGDEREVIAKALTGGKSPKDAPPSVAFAIEHCSGLKAAEKKAVAARLLGDVKKTSRKTKKKTTKKKAKR